MKHYLRIVSLCLVLAFTGIMHLSAKIISFTKDADGITCTLDKGIMKLKVCKEDIIQVKYTELSAFDTRQSLVIVNEWKSIIPFTVNDGKDEIVLSTGRLQVKINKTTNAIVYCNAKGEVILAEAGKSITPSTVAGINTNSIVTQFKSPADEALYGMGCHPEDTLSINYKGRNQDMFIKYMTGAIPVMLSTKGYGIYWDNYAASWFYGAEKNNTEYKFLSESGKMVDYYFFYGPELDKVISLYREASGVAPMFPKWAFGLFQSQDRYKSQAEVLSVKDGYRKNNYPVDCIVQDWYYWEPCAIGSHVMYPQRYPNPKKMVDELHNANIHAMISIWPVMAAGTTNFDEMKEKGYITSIDWFNVVSHTMDFYYDAHNPKARDLYWKQANDSLVGRYGFDSWWVDQCEPDNGIRLDLRRQADFSVGKGIDYFNTYSLEHSKGLYKNWRKDIPGKRPFLLIRQAFAGQQRNSATLWSSDITCTFRAYKSQVPQAINACAAGIPYWTSDIGGYHLNWTAPDWSKPEKQELFTRWFQFGCFSPIMRIHGKGERAIFSKNHTEATRAILVKYDNLRYRLLPYNYSLAWKVTSENYTILRALAFDFRTDPKIVNIPDQYMYGPAFLVNPVTEQMYTCKNADKVEKARNVYLPKATWYDFWTGKKLAGGQTLKATAPIETIPLYVRAGSIVPMGPFVQYATEKPDGEIELRIYAGANGEFTLYEDENDNYNYENGKYATIELKWNDASKTLTIGEMKGEFAGMIKNKTFNIVLVNEKQGTGIDICTKPTKTVKYTGSKVDVKVN